MKRITMAVLFTTALTVFITSSCKKEQLDSEGPPFIASRTLNLVADTWQKESSGLYVHVFRDVIPQVYLNGGINIYALSDNKDIHINNAVSFMGGHLLASQSASDIRIVFRSIALGEKPFDYLDIKVVFF